MRMIQRKRKIQTAESYEECPNPKLEGSGMLDCIPQTGQCPNKCLECFYNAEGWFRTKSESLFPPYSTKKLVRVNSGNDSNVHREYVIQATSQFKDKFYNTSIPQFDFPGPVTFTCNGRDTDYSAMMVSKGLENLMAVRFRTNLWNLDLLYEVIAYYAQRHHIPVTITFMRYMNFDNIPEQYRLFYVYKKSILNEYYILNPDKQNEVSANYAHELVGTCGKPWSSFCRDCGRCEKLYKDWKVKAQFRKITSGT
jgi:hypothetical protein